MRALKVLGIFLAGVVAGGFAAFFLASRAAPTYAHELELRYALELQHQAAAEGQQGRWLEAWSLYRSMAQLELNSGPPFGLADQHWDPLLPLAAPMLEQIRSAASHGKGRAILTGLSHARMAYALEKAGLTTEANAAWGQAMTLGGFPSIKYARDLVIEVLKQEKAVVDAH